MLNTVTDNFKDWQLLATISDALVATDASTAETTTHEEHPRATYRRSAQNNSMRHVTECC